MAGAFFARARPAAARPQPGRRRRRRTPSRPAAMLAGLEPILRRRAARRRPRLRRHELDARRRAGRGQARDPGRPRRGRPAQLRPADARGAQPGRRRPPRDAGSSRRRRRPSANLARRGDRATASSLVGDLMQDLAARVGAEVRDPAVARRRSAERLGLAADARAATSSPRSTGPENREPAAMRRLGRRSSPTRRRADRPVILALHPGTRAALDGAPGSPLAAGRRASSSRRATGRRSPSSSTRRRC